MSRTFAGKSNKRMKRRCPKCLRDIRGVGEWRKHVDRCRSRAGEVTFRYAEAG